MKKVSGLAFVLLVIALAFVFSSAASAVPDPPPNDNVCICHQTQHHKNNIGQANDNQKGVLICVDPNSLPTNKHFKHGDDCVEPFNEAPACDGSSTTLEECTGEEGLQPDQRSVQRGVLQQQSGLLGVSQCEPFTQPQCQE